MNDKNVNGKKTKPSTRLGNHTNLGYFCKHMPKVELHVHLEGTLEPSLLLKLANRNNVALNYKSIDEIHKAYQFQNLDDFLHLYYQGMSVLIKEQDFYELTWDYLTKAHSQNVRHAEVFFDPQPHLKRNVSFDTIMNGIHRALVDGQNHYGMSFKLIMCIVRDLPVDDAMRTFEMALRYKNEISGIGLDSSEKGNPPEKFSSIFDCARKEGFRVLAHAGEEGPPSYITSALDCLHVERIDHGVRCIDDSKVLHRLKEEKIPLTVCPISNIKLGVFPSMKDHPIKKMLDEGLCITVNSDDPSYFGGSYISENFVATTEHAGITQSDVIQLATNAIEASFLNSEEKKALQHELLEYTNQNENSALDN